MKTSDIAFADLRDLLLGLGFTETVEKTRLVFEHPIGGTLLFRRYKDQSKVTLGDMLLVRGQLDWNGLMDSVEFDRFQQKTPA